MSSGPLDKCAEVSRDRTGIELAGLTKSYGPVHAVRGVDLAITAGETVALLGRTALACRPDSGTISVFGTSPGEAARSGWMGGMLQNGSPPDRLRVREFVGSVASYYPHPLVVDGVLRASGAQELAGQ